MSELKPEKTETAGDLGSATTRSASTQDRGSGEPRALRSGDAVGRYTIRELLGAGGMGQVFAAFDSQLGRVVALKVINPHRLGASQTRARFLREAQALARLSHANVVTVFDAGSHEGHVFVAMELVEGTTLSRWLRDRPRTWRQVRDAFVAAGRGLEAVHAAGLVHRDFKPQNVLVAADRVVVLDFGLARADDEPAEDTPRDPSGRDALSVSVTLTGELLGTPRYMAPEQLAGKPATARSDQFGFCVALFEALYGCPPFPGKTVGEFAEATARGAIAVPADAKVPRFLAAAVTRGLNADPERRHPTMTALLAEVARDPGRAARRWLLAGAATLSLVAAGAAFAWRSGMAPGRSCAGAAAELEARWQPERRHTLQSAFAAVPGAPGADAWRRAEPVLEGWAARWRTQSVDACEGGTRSPLAAARRACLDRRLGELDGLLTALGTPDATIVQYAGTAAHALTPPETCLGALPSTAAPPPPASSEALARGRAHLDAATALRRVGKPRPGLAEAEAAAAEADRIGWPPFTAEAKLELGAAQLAVRATEAAGEAYWAALWSAELAGDDAQRFEATMGVERVELERSSFVEAGRSLRTASAIDQHLPGDPTRRLRLALAGARLASMRGQFRECVVLGEEAVARAEQTSGPEAPAVASALMTTAECQEALGEGAIAHGTVTRALAIAEKVYGHDHQQTANLLSDLASLERQAGQYADAERDSREVLAIRERVVGPDSPDCAAARNNLANLLRELGRHDEARREVDQALAIWIKAWSADSPAVAVGLGTRAAIAMAEGHPAAAEPDLRRALEIRRKLRGAGHPETLRSIEQLATALQAQGKREAVALLDEAAAGADAAARPRLRFLAGKARVELAVDRAAGLGQAQAACQELEAGADKKALAECQAWLAHRR